MIEPGTTALCSYFGPVLPKPRSVSAGSYVTLGVILLAGTLVNVWHAQQAWSGPDGELYLEFASLMRSPGYFLNPESFWGNYWPSGYPIFLSALGFASESPFQDVALVNVAANSLSALGCWFLTSRLNTRLRLVVVALVVVCPDVLWASRAIGYEALLSCLLVWSLAFAWSIGIRRNQALCCGISGVLLVLAVIVQSRSIVLLPVLLILSYRRGVGAVAGFFAGCGLVSVPWVIRGYLTYGRFSLLTTNGPINVWIGSNPEATTGGYMGPPVTPNGYVNGSLQFLKDTPYEFLDLTLRRSARLFVPIADDPGWSTRVDVLYSLWAFVFAIALSVGLVLWWTGCLWRGPSTMPPVAPIAIAATIYLVSALPFLIEPRYRMPITPLLVCVLVPMLASGWLALRERWRPEVMTTT